MSLRRRDWYILFTVLSFDLARRSILKSELINSGLPYAVLLLMLPYKAFEHLDRYTHEGQNAMDVRRLLPHEYESVYKGPLPPSLSVRNIRPLYRALRAVHFDSQSSGSFFFSR
jgi:hypothetical protein